MRRSWKSSIRSATGCVSINPSPPRKHRVSLSPIIRRESPGDFPGIRRLLTEAYPTPDEADLVEELRAREALPISLVAVQSAAIVGYLGFSPVTLVPPAAASLWGLAPLAIAPALQRQG